MSSPRRIRIYQPHISLQISIQRVTKLLFHSWHNSSSHNSNLHLGYSLLLMHLNNSTLASTFFKPLLHHLLEQVHLIDSVAILLIYLEWWLWIKTECYSPLSQLNSTLDEYVHSYIHTANTICNRFFIFLLNSNWF